MTRMTIYQLRRRVLKYFHRCVMFDMWDFELVGPEGYPAMPEVKQILLKRIENGKRSRVRVGSVSLDVAENVEYMLRLTLDYHLGLKPEGLGQPMPARDCLLRGLFDPLLDKSDS